MTQSPEPDRLERNREVLRRMGALDTDFAEPPSPRRRDRQTGDVAGFLPAVLSFLGVLLFLMGAMGMLAFISVIVMSVLNRQLGGAHLATLGWAVGYLLIVGGAFAGGYGLIRLAKRAGHRGSHTIAGSRNLEF